VGAAVPAQHATGRVVRLEVADHEAAAVVVDDQRVRPTRLGRRVVTGANRAVAAVDLDVAHLPHRDLAAGEHLALAAHHLARDRRRERLDRRVAAALHHREHQLNVGLEREAVELHRRPARQLHLRARRQRGHRAGNAHLEAFARLQLGLAAVGGRGCARGRPHRKVEA
jgi:hypothetical protein